MGPGTFEAKFIPLSKLSCVEKITVFLVSQFTKNKEKTIILDVGCGKGNITKNIQDHFPNVFIDAIDVSDIAINLALKGESKINFVKADANNFKGFGYLYDIIVLNNIYEHVENPVGMFINLKKLLTHDGVFIISTPNRYHIKNILRKFAGLTIKIPKYHLTEYSIGQIYDHHKQADLNIKKLVLPNIKREKVSFINFLIFKILQPLVDAYLKALKSKERLSSLLFIVSRKN